ncbi:MAG: hypothetical protein LBC67_02970 [Spirochaetales bacterium]|nr:hypothetical protein [Spirochaetales bacterium]
MALFLLALWGVQPLSAENLYTVENIRFVPQTFYVGDRVELRLTVRAAASVQLTPPKNLPDISWGEFHDARVIPREAHREILIVFTSYETGSHTIPAMKFGDIVLEGLIAGVASLTDETFRDPAPHRGVLLLPGSRLVIALIAGILAALPLTFAAFRIWLRPVVGRLAAFSRERRPYRKLKKELSHLRSHIAEMDSRAFYISLLLSVKTYLTLRGKGNYLAWTTREMEAASCESLAYAAKSQELLSMFHFGDEVKFGGRTSSREKRLLDLGLVTEFSAKLEKGQDSHVYV